MDLRFNSAIMLGLRHPEPRGVWTGTLRCMTITLIHPTKHRLTACILPILDHPTSPVDQLVSVDANLLPVTDHPSSNRNGRRSVSKVDGTGGELRHGA